MFHLAEEWGKVEKVLSTVKMLPGENHRERVLTPEEESLYFSAASSTAMEQHADPRLLADVARILLDCGLRPEECFRLRPENVVGAKLEIHFGKTDNARRRIPMTPQVQAILEMRLSKPGGGKWVFPAPTMSGHIEPSQSQETACEGGFRGHLHASEGDGRPQAQFRRLRAIHSSAYLSHQVGAAHGPVDPSLPGRTPRYEHHQALRSPARADDP